jgi:hypothetical protein
MANQKGIVPVGEQFASPRARAPEAIRLCANIERLIDVDELFATILRIAREVKVIWQ